MLPSSDQIFVTFLQLLTSVARCCRLILRFGQVLSNANVVRAKHVRRAGRLMQKFALMKSDSDGVVEFCKRQSAPDVSVWECTVELKKVKARLFQRTTDRPEALIKLYAMAAEQKKKPK